jgi:hypothetical protein
VGDRYATPSAEGSAVVKTKVLHEAGERTVAIVFETGEEVVTGLERFARENALVAARFTAIGAFSDARIGYFEWERKDYKEIAIDEQVEVLSLIGDIALKGSKPGLHAHVVLGRSDGTALGGHLLQAHVRPTLEVILEESPRHLRRTIDPETGLALIELD